MVGAAPGSRLIQMTAATSVERGDIMPTTAPGGVAVEGGDAAGAAGMFMWHLVVNKFGHTIASHSIFFPNSFRNVM